MNRTSHLYRLLLSTLVVVGLALPSVAQAQQLPKDAVAFKASTAGVASGAVIPVEPPVLAGVLNFKGDSAALGGEITMTDTHVAHLGVDGVFLRSTDGRAAFVGKNGDAIYIQWSGAARPTETANLYAFTGAFTVTGGKGRYAGYIGSGIMNSRVNLATFEVAQVWEGVLVPSKK